MAANRVQYLIVGGGLAAASCAEGVRQLDSQGAITLLSGEPYLPYDRPPLTKKLWTGKKTEEQIFLHDLRWYEEKGISVVRNTPASHLRAQEHIVVDANGVEYRYDKLLIATGAIPLRLPIPGADLPGVVYYRTYQDFLTVKNRLGAGSSCLIVGGGFIGSEIAPSLLSRGVTVSMLFPEEYLCKRVFPSTLGTYLTELYRQRGIAVNTNDVPVAISQEHERLRTVTRTGTEFLTDLVIVGVGVAPSDSLARDAGLAVGKGVVVNKHLQTSAPDVYAAGDVALFSYRALDRTMRIEHWDNALSQGLCAGHVMAGSIEEYTHMPYFFSDLFEFGYEAVGDIDSRNEVFTEWDEEYTRGTLYYAQGGTIRGVMYCNLWDRIEEARDMIRRKVALPAYTR